MCLADAAQVIWIEKSIMDALLFHVYSLVLLAFTLAHTLQFDAPGGQHNVMK